MGKVTLLPIGAIEEHGLLPVDTDTVIAKAFCTLAARRLDAVVENAIERGFCPTTCDLAGTKGFRCEEIFGHVSMRIRSLIEENRRYIVAVNVHGGNSAILTAVVQDIYVERRFPVFYFNPYTVFADELNRVCFGDCDNSFKECSLLRASIAILGDKPISGPNVDQDTRRDPLVEDLKEVGVVGFSYRNACEHIAWRSGATIEAGRRFLEATVERFVPVIDKFKCHVENELDEQKQTHNRPYHG